ncbi:MAG: hypothetical protein JWO75_3988 [Actinomycetia bacterium]|nr:hypothetical protein [Actinomycetes bacterium]
MATQPASPRRPRPVIVGEARRYGPAEVFWGGAGRGDCGSSGCLAPEGRPVRPLCPGLLVLRAGCFRDRGSPGADIATFDPQSRNSPVMVVGLFCFMAVRRRSAGCSPRDDPRSRPRTADGPQGTGPATGRQAAAPLSDPERRRRRMLRQENPPSTAATRRGRPTSATGGAALLLTAGDLRGPGRPQPQKELRAFRRRRAAGAGRPQPPATRAGHGCGSRGRGGITPRPSGPALWATSVAAKSRKPPAPTPRVGVMSRVLGKRAAAPTCRR